MGIPVDEAELIAIFLETFLYGIFSTLFWITLWVLLKQRPEAKRKRILISALFFMLALSTTHIIIDFIRIIEAFIFFRNKPGGPNEYYARLAHPLHVTKNLLFTTMSLTGDVVMAWRCYVVYGRNYLVIVFPVCLLAATAACGYAAIVIFSSTPLGSTIFTTATPWITYFFVLSLFSNTYCTGSIVFRIWRSMKSLGPCHPGNRGLMPVVVVLIESGCLHATAWLTLLISYVTGSNGQYVVLDTVTPIVGIVFCTIIIRIDAFASGMRISSSQINRSGSLQRPSQFSPIGYVTNPVGITVTTHQAVFIDSPVASISDHTSSLNETKNISSLEAGLV